ncbi:MAG: transcriptional repressor [Oligoflexia bacterium]|nr:transcriptional repressor [Oligoflexia bacterium]
MSKPLAKRPRNLPCGRPAPAEHDAPKAAKLEEWQGRLRAYLSGKGLKYSEQRWKIAELILSTGGHLDAQGLVERVKKAHPGIGAATVYRSIKVLCDARILKESLSDSQRRVIYELFDDEHHDHIVCTDCGAIFEFHSEKIEAAQNAILEEQQFTQTKHRHVIYAKCAYKAEKRPSK